MRVSGVVHSSRSTPLVREPWFSVTRRTADALPQNERVSQPTFAPDGRALYFIRTERGRPPTLRVYRLSLGGAPTDTAMAVTPPQLMVRSFSFNADGSAMMLNVLDPASNNRTVSRLQLFTLATGTLAAPPTPPGDEVANPVLRPAAAPSSNR